MNNTRSPSKPVSWDLWYPPELTRFGEPLALQMRNWLFGSTTASTASAGRNPEEWANSGYRIALKRRVLQFDAIAAGASAALATDMGGGLNSIVLSRFASVEEDAGADTVLEIPNNIANFTTVQVIRADQFVEVETVPLSHHFGTVPGWPDTPAVPEFWLNNLQKTFTITNNWYVTVNVSLSFEYLVIFGGR